MSTYVWGLYKICVLFRALVYSSAINNGISSWDLTLFITNNDAVVL